MHKAFELAVVAQGLRQKVLGDIEAIAAHGK